MALKRQSLRYAHSEGHADVCYTYDGKFILSCGGDGDIRVFLGLEDDDPESICAGERALSVLCVPNKESNRIYVSTDRICVQALTFPKGDPDGIIVKFESLVSHIAIDKNAKILVAGSFDFTVKVVSIEDNKILNTFSDGTAPVLSVALCPKNEYVAASYGDGFLRIFSLATNSVQHQIFCVPSVTAFDTAAVLCRMSFDPKGSTIAYPDKSEVIVLSVGDWSRQMTLQDTRAQGVFSNVTFSPCGKFIAGSTTTGCICLWNVSTQTTIGYTPHPNKRRICGMVWNPLGNGEVAYIDTTGQIGTVINCGVSSTTAIVEIEQDIHADSDEDNENAISLEKLKADTLSLPMFDEDTSRPTSRNSVQSVSPPAVTVTPLQPPFQPGSTPLHLMERYLVWNNVGVVRSLLAENGENSFIDVRFNDTTIHCPLHLTNHMNYTMAGLSKTVFALACETPSQLYCIPLAGGKEWTTQLPEGEEVLSLTVSDSLVAIATDVRYLRIFTVHGNQRNVISLPGPVLTLTAQNNSILVAYHKSPGVGSDQNLSLQVIVLEGLDLRSADINLPLTPGSTLTWIGYTNSGVPVTYDSSSIMRLFSSRSSVWMPIFDYTSSQKGVSDGLFIVSVNAVQQKIEAIACKGSCYPPITPRPVINDFEFRIPMCENETDKSQTEDLFARTSQLDRDSPEVQKALLRAAIGVFSLACRTDFDQRAFEIAEMMTEVPKFISVAIEYASRRGRTHLASKLNVLEQTVQKNGFEVEAAFSRITEINESKHDSLAAMKRNLPADQPKDRQHIPKPLGLKRAAGKSRVVICKNTPENQSFEFDSQIEINSSMTATEKEKTPTGMTKNPFKKSQVTSTKNERNPFSVSGSFDSCDDDTQKNRNKGGFGSELSILSNKRKQPDSEPTEFQSISKQSKLSGFVSHK